MNKAQERLIRHAIPAIRSGLTISRRLKVSVTAAELVEVLQYLEAHCTAACVGETSRVRFRVRHHVSTGWMTAIKAAGARIDDAKKEEQVTRFKLLNGKTICSRHQEGNLPILWWVGDFADEPLPYVRIDIKEEYAVLEAINALEAKILIGEAFTPTPEEIVGTLQRVEDLFVRLYDREPDSDKKDEMLALSGPWRRDILSLVKAKPLPYNSPGWPPTRWYQLPSGEVITFRGLLRQWMLHRLH